MCKATDLHPMMDARSQSGVKPDTTTYNAMLSAYCSAEKLEEALEFAEGMRKDGVTPDGVTFNSVLIANSLLRRYLSPLTRMI